MYNIKDLETKGYCVIPGFLNQEEVQAFMADQRGGSSGINQNYTITVPGSNVVSGIYGKMKAIMSLVRDNTSIKVDILTGEKMYTDNTKHFFEWHQDHESYFVFQQSSNYLNFYIPIVKPSANKSGLSVIPLDRLKEKQPQFHDFVINNGALAFYPVGNKTKMVNSNDDSITILDFDLGELSVTPDLMAGDLLLLRGDVIHTTQDTTEHRISVSIRAVDGDSIISKQKLFTLNDRKKKFMMNNKAWYKKILDFFNSNKIDSTTAKQLIGNTND